LADEVYTRLRSGRTMGHFFFSSWTSTTHPRPARPRCKG